jgi:hypothetical protein
MESNHCITALPYIVFMLVYPRRSRSQFIGGRDRTPVYTSSCLLQSLTCLTIQALFPNPLLCPVPDGYPHLPQGQEWTLSRLRHCCK